MKNFSKIEAFDDVIKNTLDRIYIKKTDNFFELQPCILDQKITDIQIQCEGYSLFEPDVVLNNFFNFFTKIMQQVRKNKNYTIKTIKINLNGFKLKPKQDRIKKMIELIVDQSIGQNIKTFWFHTSDLQNVSLSDFGVLLGLMIGLKQGGENINFQDFSLQCANWTFYPRQPTFKEFMNVFDKQLKQNIDQSTKLRQRNIRIQISGWWYKAADAKIFFQFAPNQKQLKQIDKPYLQAYKQPRRSYQDSKQQYSKLVQSFHIQMQGMISDLLRTMTDIELLQIDMRNMNQLFQMKKLKQMINSRTINLNRGEKSLISMKQNVSYNSNNRDQGDEKKFRLNCMM